MQQRHQDTSYLLLIMIGLGIVAYIYLINFDSYSETQLIRLTSLWMFPLVFGIYGFVAQKFIQQSYENNLPLHVYIKKNILSNSFFKPLLILLFIPFFVVHTIKPNSIALVGALLWTLFLWLFFEFVFPVL